MADSFHLWTTFVTRKSLEGIKVITVVKLFSCCSPSVGTCFQSNGHPFQSLMRGFLSDLYPFVMVYYIVVAETAFFSVLACVLWFCVQIMRRIRNEILLWSRTCQASFCYCFAPLQRPVHSCSRIVGYIVASICVMVLALVPFLLNAKSL